MHYVWVILCPRPPRKRHTPPGLVGERLAPPARARKRSDVTRGHMWTRGHRAVGNHHANAAHVALFVVTLLLRKILRNKIAPRCSAAR